MKTQKSRENVAMSVVVTACIMVACAFLTPSTARATSIYQSWEFGPTRVSMNAQQADGGRVYMSASASTTLLIESVSSNLYPEWNDPSEWIWQVSIDGRRDKNAVVQELSMNSNRNVAPVSFWQNSYLGWSQYDLNPLYDYAGASAELCPANINQVSGNYSEWENTWGGGGGGKGIASITLPLPPIPPMVTEQWWGFSGIYRGSFGPGEAGDKLGRAFFGIPEPASLVLLTLGSTVLLRRRRRVA